MDRNTSWRRWLLGAAVAVFLLGGCASTGDPRDPLEPVNRAIYKFNDGFDHLIAKPAAQAYRDLVPAVIRTGIGNFFSNLNDVIVALNDLLQGKVPDAINDVGRILVNTTLGVLGFMDPATELGVEKRNEDFGQTLGYWGLGDGPYIVLPFLGPSSLRDSVGWVGDAYTWPGTYLRPYRDRNVLIGMRFTAARADLLEAGDLLETAALDPYEFLRDAYLQRRRNLVYDGKPPDEIEPEPKAKPQSQGRLSIRFEAGDSGPWRGGNWQSQFAPIPLEPTQPVTAPAPAPSPEPSAENDEAPGKPRMTRVWLPSARN